MTTNYTPIVPIATGYYLEETQGIIEAIVPEKRTNYILNPAMSDQDNNNIPDGYTYVTPNGSTGKTASGPFWRHYYSIVAANDNDFFKTSADVAALTGTLTASVFVRSSNAYFNIIIKGNDANTNANLEYTSRVFHVQSEEWEQYEYTFKTPNGIKNTTMEIRFIETNPIVAQYIDIAGFQLEKGEYGTTFIHGYAGEGYKWLGQPFNSPSQRSEDAICGGKVYNLRKLGFRLTAINGLGIPDDLDINSQPKAFGLGSVFTCRSIESREITLEGVIYGCNLQQFLSKRNNIGYAIFDMKKPRCFKFRPISGCTTLPCVEFTGLLDEGFSFGYNSHHGEEIELKFVNLDILINDCNTTCIDVDVTQTTHNSAILPIAEDGSIVELDAFNPVDTKTISGVTYSTYTGKFYAIANGNLIYRIAEWDGNQWKSIILCGREIESLYTYGNKLFAGTKGGGTFWGAAFNGWTGTSGRYLCVADLDAKEVANITQVPLTQVHNAAGVLENPGIYCFAGDPYGFVWIGGNFAPWGTSLEPDLIRYKISNGAMDEHGVSGYYDSSYLSSYNLGGIRDLLFIEEKSQLWGVGDFNRNQSSGVTTMAQTYFGYGIGTGEGELTRQANGNYPYAVTKPTFSSIAKTGDLRAVEYYKGRVIIGGLLQVGNTGDTSTAYPSSVNGIAWLDDNGFIQPFDNELALTGDNYSSPVVYDMDVCNDVLHIVGNIQDYGTLDSNLAWFIPALPYQVRGQLCGAAEFFSAGSAESGDVLEAQVHIAQPDCFAGQIVCTEESDLVNRIYVNTATNQATSTFATVDASTTITLCKNHNEVYPRLYIKGPGTLIKITNLTTETSVYLDYEFSQLLSNGINSAEILEFDFSQNPITINSNFFGNVSNKIELGSQRILFSTGDNYLVLQFTGGSVQSNTQAWSCWTNNALSAESLQMECK